MGFGQGRGVRTAQQDARMERQVSLAARNLGDGVQKIVIAAKTKQGGAEWKTDLLDLLGNVAASKDAKKKSDVDVLLENSKCEKFILRCVEAELPPNLIHCLRLIRVVELQNSSQHAEASAGEATSTMDEIRPVALKATQKVTRLLCLLCRDTSVGEQLRPHLFGLLALSGASYPPSGVHVASAASEVISAVADYCLTRQLVWFVHDRKMILHMTDDIKELTGLTQAAGGTVPMCLTGHEAEKAGLWFIAFRTVVQLLSSSCRFNTIDLVKDFEAAGGYEVLKYAIDHSTTPHGGKLVALLPDLVCCPSRQPEENFDEANLKIAANVRPMLMQEDLLHRSNPLWEEFQEEHAGKAPNLDREGMLRRLAFLSLKKAARLHALSDEDRPKYDHEFQYDMPSALLHSTLQVFADHPDNYSIIEGRQHILSCYLLSFPCYHDEDLKNFVLKTLEFVLTGVGVSEEVTPVNACVEIFFALCHVLISDGEDVLGDDIIESRDQVLSSLSQDAVLMGTTLEKLLQFDQRVAPLIIESGVMTRNLDSLLQLIMDNHKIEKGTIPLASTSVDSTFSTVCNVLKLLVAHQPVGFSKEPNETGGSEEPTNLHKLLRMAVNMLGEDACLAAAGVFESYLCSFASLDALRADMMFVLRIVDQLAQTTEGALNLTSLGRQAMLLSLLRSVLEARSLARDAFRTCEGFSAILRTLMALEGSFLKEAVDEEKRMTFMKLLETVVGLIDASIGIKSKNALSVSEVSPVVIPDNIVVDPTSSQLSSADTPAPLNRNFIRQNSYYLDLSAAIACTGILQSDLRSRLIELAFSHVDPLLKPSGEKNEDISALRNPDAIRFLLGIAIFLYKEEGGLSVAEGVLDDMLRLTERKMSTTTLGQIASCGICWSLTNEDEFGSFLFSDENPLQSRFVAMLCSIASFSSSYMDFVGLLRRSAGPMLAKSGPEGRLIKIPVISSSLGRKQPTTIQETKSEDSDHGSARDEEMVPRLRALRDIARYPDRFPRLVLGGDSINAIGVMMHQIKLEERLRSAAEEGRLRFVEVESVDASALHAEDTPAVDSSSYGSTEPIWYPLASSGFSYSCWLRHSVAPGSGVSGNLYIMDISSPNLVEFSSKNNSAFLGLWFDLQNQRFNVMSSASHRGEPICFPVSPLVPHVWHHILVTYTPGKRSMISRKSVFSIFVDGRPLEAEVKVDTVNLPPNARMIMGAPNPALAASGIVRGKLPLWEMGPCFLLSTVLLELDATAIYSYGTDFPGLLWGDRPERQSLSSTASCLFGALAEAGELGSVASALRRRDIAKMEGAGSNMILHSDKNDLAALNLYCTIPPESVIFGYQPGTVRWKVKNDMARQDRRLSSERLANIARLGFCNTGVSTDAVIYGRGGLLAPLSLADSLRWAGGPNILMPIINAAESSKTLTLSLQILRECCRRHQPNLEAMQGGGGFRILAVLLQEKGTIDEQCLDQCMAFAIHGFEPVPSSDSSSSSYDDVRGLSHIHWVLTDLEAMKHILLNHQVWDLRKFGPTLPLRLLSVLNRLVDHKSLHKAFNARRLHMVGIVRWGLHLMLEAAELYTAGDTSVQLGESAAELDATRGLDSWVCEAPYVSDVSAGGDPGNPFLQACKNLLRRVLTFMLTPGDLEALSEALVYTVSLSTQSNSGTALGKRASLVRAMNEKESDPRMLPASTARLYLVRLLEELIVDGVNEIVASASTAHESKGSGVPAVEHTVQPHAGGVASPNQPYLSTPALKAKTMDGLFHPKHLQAQAFLGAFAGFLNPIWFATLLEGCREEASASAVVRLMVLMLQASTSFESAFQESGEFGPFVMSVPRFSTCPSIIISLLSQHFGVPILHIHALSSLDPENLCEVFDAEFEVSDDESPVSNSGDPANGIFALIAECAGRNLQLLSTNSALENKAAIANRAILHLLAHRHTQSESFRRYCASPVFIEPFAQSLCLLYTQNAVAGVTPRRGSKLADVPKDLSPTERFIGGAVDESHRSFGFLLLLQQIISHAFSLLGAARTIHCIFSSIPVHATPQEVKAFHLVLIEQCSSYIEKLLEGDEVLPLANCVGVLSVFLEQQVQGFSTTEAVLRTAQISIQVLSSLTDRNSKAWQAPGPEHALVATDAAHIARLICALSLRWSIDRADEDLLLAILELIETNIEMLLLVPSRERNIPVGPPPKVSAGSQLFPYWQSDSLSRCFPDRMASFPEISDANKEVDIASIAPLIVSLHSLLSSPSEELRSLAIAVFVALLRHRESTMSALLVAQFNRGSSVETVDVVSRGGFRALLAAHEAAEMNKTAKSQSVKKRYASFFDWREKNMDTVQLLFDNIEDTSLQKFPGLEQSIIQQEDAVENEQKHIVTRITEQGSADQTILGGLRRADLSRRCAERTAEYHGRWKRQGFDDLAFGAMKWKTVLRQMKGSHSIWEGGQIVARKKEFNLTGYLSVLRERLDMKGKRREPEVLDFVVRWKLDLSEGFERQRRRLLPNHEFHGLYNLDEDAEFKTVSDNDGQGGGEADFLSGGGQMVATAEILKDLNLKRGSILLDEFEEAETADDSQTVATASTALSGADSAVDDTKADDAEATGKEEATQQTPDTNEDSSSYELINGLLLAGDYPERSYNIRRCTGLEVAKALLLWCSEAIYIVDGFEQTIGEDMEPRINRVEKEKAIYNVALRQKKPGRDSTPSSTPGNAKRPMSRGKSMGVGEQLTSEVLYHHRSKRISFDELYAVFRRRYQLQQNALEFFDTNKHGTLIAFDGNKEREEVLGRILRSKLPNSIFYSSYGTYMSYAKVMSNLKTKIETQWVNGKMSNFDFLMHLNSLAGRSFNDLTQYPVFPWVIADYESEELDFDDPATFRDLSKPMGALGTERANQFRERYESLASSVQGDDDPPPFHYGTHYSTSAYVLYYMMRLEPFSRLALALQGGRFDVADRLFHDVGKSWRNASEDNLQDVRELIPEFYYLPDFLVNTNNFDFGETQKGKTVDDVTLPKWAKGDPYRFVRLNRKALESPIVSRHLHRWVDLIFGYKQRGEEAVAALNTFVHVTYEGEVDIDSMDDPIQRESTIAQIQNFGQTPKQLERRPFAARNVVTAVKDRTIDYSAIVVLAPLTPPLCVAGAPHRIKIKPAFTDMAKVGVIDQPDKSVGDVYYVKGQLVGTGSTCALLGGSKRYLRFGGLNNGISVHTAMLSTRYREVDKLLSIHDGLHKAPICAVKSSDGSWLVTGSIDSTVRVWHFDGEKLFPKATLCGHEGSLVRCIDLSTEFGMIVTGCAQGRVLVWDLRSMTFVRALQHDAEDASAISVSINNKNGNVIVLVGTSLSLSDINGRVVAAETLSVQNAPTCAVATDCPEWTDDGVVAVTGHMSGEIRLWGLDYDTSVLTQLLVVPENPLTNPISVLRLTGVERQDTLLAGDKSGRISVFKAAQLENMSSDDLSEIVEELSEVQSTKYIV